ncbi:MAG: hypothetical protein ACLPN6_07090 [Streptosporangiaceae bacterium]
MPSAPGGPARRPVWPGDRRGKLRARRDPAERAATRPGGPQSRLRAGLVTPYG